MRLIKYIYFKYHKTLMKDLTKYIYFKHKYGVIQITLYKN